MKRSLALCLILPLVALASQEGGLTVEEAVTIGLAQSRTLRASAARVDAAEARAAEARTARLPILKGEASYRRLSDVDPFQVQLPMFSQPIVISPTVLDNTAMRVSLQQPLFTGFRISSTIRVAEAGAEAATLDHASDQSDLVLNIAAAYWTLYQARETERFAGENVTRLEQYARDTDRLLSAGAATRNDVLRVQVQLSTARLGGIDAGNDARLAAMNLNILLGRPVDMPIQLASIPGQTPSPVPLALDSLVRSARHDRSDLQALRMRVEASRAGVRAAQAGWWPQLALSGGALYARPNSRYMPTRDEFKSTWDIGVVLSMDLWNWGQTASQAAQAEATLRQTELLTTQMEEMVSLEVHRASLLASRAAERTDVAGQALRQAEEQSRMTEDKYRNGLATAADLLDAEVALLQAKTTLSGARVEQEIARARLAKATGSIVP